MANLEILGFDEVGRGCLAGPVVVGCVLGNRTNLFNKPEEIILKDSKKMSRNQRGKTSFWIGNNFAYGLGLSEAWEIDSIGIAGAVRMAAVRALAEIKHNFPEDCKGGYMLQNDGNQSWFDNCAAIIGGDNIVAEISMASIIAKVYRDNLIASLDLKYPGWKFKSHVGYGTAYHIDQIKKYGLLKGIHRISFCRNFS